MYTYKAVVGRVIDGDTLKLSILVGFNVIVKDTVRLYGINTPETRGKERPDGLAVKEHVKTLIEHKTVTIKTFQDKKGKYGRYLAVVFIDGENLNASLIDTDRAEEEYYGNKIEDVRDVTCD